MTLHLPAAAGMMAGLSLLQFFYFFLQKSGKTTDLKPHKVDPLLGIDDINAHLERLTKLKRLLPAYAGKRVLGAVASMVIADNVAQYAFRKGLYVIGQSGEHLQIRNAEDFTAKSW